MVSTSPLRGPAPDHSQGTPPRPRTLPQATASAPVVEDVQHPDHTAPHPPLRQPAAENHTALAAVSAELAPSVASDMVGVQPAARLDPSGSAPEEGPSA